MRSTWPRACSLSVALSAMVLVSLVGSTTGGASPAADLGRVAAGGVLRVSVPEAFGGKTVVGQLTVARAVGDGFVTAYGCADGLPTQDDGRVSRSDLNFDGSVSSVASNRLIVQADAAGDVCFYTLRPAALIVDINGVTFDTGINSFPNRRTDTRSSAEQRVAAGGVLRVSVPEAFGGKTVVGQLTVGRAVGDGYVTAYGCADGLPRHDDGRVSRSDLNFDGSVSPVASNRLIVQADAAGDVCFYTLRPAALIVDINGVADDGIGSFPNRRTDTRLTPGERVSAGAVLRIFVPEAVGGKTVVGQLTVGQVSEIGFVTAYGCDEGLPVDGSGLVNRSDLNFDGSVSPTASNRLIVRADAAGHVCFLTSRSAALVVDVNGASAVGISSFANRRIDTRLLGARSTPRELDTAGVPVWSPYEPVGPYDGVAALTGLPTANAVSRRPVVAVKIDNYRLARPQWALDLADVVFEENVEGVTRFVALFHSHHPGIVGPIRSARTGDLDLLAAMNRPVFAFSGANLGVTAWIGAAAQAGVVVDFSAQREPCFWREDSRPRPHNLLLDASCAAAAAPSAGPARPLWGIDADWSRPANARPDTEFTVAMDGVRVQWAWDHVSKSYLRSQDGDPHLSASETRISAANVIELVSVHVPSPVDARSPHPVTVGTGAAVIHRDGWATPAVWSRGSPDDSFEFFHVPTGLPVALDSGVTFVELTRAD